MTSVMEKVIEDHGVAGSLDLFDIPPTEVWRYPRLALLERHQYC